MERLSLQQSIRSWVLLLEMVSLKVHISAPSSLHIPNVIETLDYFFTRMLCNSTPYYVGRSVGRLVIWSVNLFLLFRRF